MRILKNPALFGLLRINTIILLKKEFKNFESGCAGLCKNYCDNSPLEFVFQEQSYSSLHSGWSLAWYHVRGNTDDPCGAIADFCGVIADPCGVVAIPEAIGGH